MNSEGKDNTGRPFEGIPQRLYYSYLRFRVVKNGKTITFM